MARFCVELILFVIFFIQSSFEDCVWYGQCNEENGKIQNCPAEEPGPFPFQNETKSLEILKKNCPLMIKKYPGKKFCCDDKQVETMAQSMGYAAGLFARCPTCMTNLNQHICLMTCSPDQSEFLEPIKIVENKEGKKYIKAVNAYISEEYMEKTFESCRETIVPSTGMKAIDISCGVSGSNNDCTAEKWFRFFGDFKENLVAPFDVHYVSKPKQGFKILDIKVLPCNESYESSKKCSCSDCEASCSIPFNYHVPGHTFTIGKADGVALIMLVIYGVLGAIVTVALIKYHRKAKSGEFPIERKDSNMNKRNKHEKFGKTFEEFLEKIFTKLGTFCARHPVLILAIFSWAIAGFGWGVTRLKITTDPIEIWASPTCQTRQEKNYFDTRFAPFYRTNQVFIKSKGLKPFNWTSSSGSIHEFGPVFHCEFLREVYQLQMNIQELGSDQEIGLKNICFAPMKSEFFNDDSIDYCAIQSIWGYLKNDLSLCDKKNRLYSKLQKCLRNNYDPSCVAPYGGPIFSPLAVGGYQRSNESIDYLLATGLTLTFLVNNDANKTQLEAALKWEKMFIDFLKQRSQQNESDLLEIAFSAERSIEDEIARESEAEMSTIIVSYLVMFLYITVALGKIRKLSSLMSDTKFSLGFGGIAIVLASVFASLGIFGYLGVATTLLTIEVIPFFVLAVGVDNIFILVNQYQESQAGNTEMSIEEAIGSALGKVGPPILLSSASEAACFLIGTLSDMPAIKTFAQYSSLAIVLNFVLQCSCFVSILSLDSKRQEKNLADIICCLQLKKGNRKSGEHLGLLHVFFKNYYGPFIMKPSIRIFVILVFLFWLCVSIACIPHIDIGLDQQLTMPEDSYVINYFQFMSELLSVGPPVYFIIKNGLNFTKTEEVNAICGSVGCDSDSMVTYLTRASKLSNSSYLAKTPSSWIDDYFDWLLNSKQCCKEFRENGSFCPHHINECETCDVKIMDWRPRENDFDKYLPYFLNDNPDFRCAKAGHAAYGGGVNYERNVQGGLEVKDNYFMTYHTSLKTSRDFYMALENARNIANHLSQVLAAKLNRTVEVFPYSVFYVYYEQYLNIVKDSFVSLGLSLVSVFTVTFLLTGFDLKSSLLVCFTVTLILVNVTGALYWWNISLNAISLVNLLVAVGIGVEFCSHNILAFKKSPNSDGATKAIHALGSMGVSVFTGITITKFLGIIVLAFAQTVMLRTFYFKMYFIVIVVGVTHGLLLLPVLLSYMK